MKQGGAGYHIGMTFQKLKSECNIMNEETKRAKREAWKLVAVCSIFYWLIIILLVMIIIW